MSSLAPTPAARTPDLEGLRRGELHLWLAAPGPEAAAALSPRLAEAERTRGQAFRYPRRRHEYLTTRGLVRSALAAYASTPPAGFRFREGSHGRPELDPPSPLRFNLSHCEGLVACLVALDREVGLDVEPADRGDEVLELSPRVFTEEERRALAAAPTAAARAHQAVLRWTLKESYLKARGLGLSLPPDAVGFTLGDATARLDPTPEDGAPASWTFATFTLGPHQVALTAGPDRAGAPPAALTVHRLPLSPATGVDTSSVPESAAT